MTETKILFTSDEEAEKAWYVRLESKIYWENEFIKMRVSQETDSWYIIYADESTYTEDGCYFHSDYESGDYWYADNSDCYYSNDTESWNVITWAHRNETWDNVNEAIYVEEDDNYYESDYFFESGWREDRHGNFTFNWGWCLDWYHSSTWDDLDLTNDDDTLKFWIELERSEICGDGDDHKKYRFHWWRCEEDASVEAEYITPILSLNNYEESIKWIKDTWNDILYGEIDDNCGGHIHISSTKVDSQQRLWRKIRYFMPLFWALYPERALNSYCEKNLRVIWEFDNRTDRMSDCNFSSRTCEIRIFPWCDNENTLRFRLKLLHLIISKAESWALEDMNKWIDLVNIDKIKTSWSFKEAIEFVKSSRDLMEILALVYSSVEKIDRLVSRIIPAFQEAIESQSEAYTIKSTGSFAQRMKIFVANEKYNNVEA